MRPNLSIVPSRDQQTTELQQYSQDTVANMVAALSVAFQIRPGRELVLTLGSGLEQSNEEALNTWVKAHLERFGVEGNRQGLATLTVELEKQLNGWLLDQEE